MKENMQPKKVKLETEQPFADTSDRAVLGENRPYFANCNVYLKY